MFQNTLTHTHYLHEQIAFKLTQHAYVNEIANPVSQKWLLGTKNDRASEKITGL